MPKTASPWLGLDSLQSKSVFNQIVFNNMSRPSKTAEWQRQNEEFYELLERDPSLSKLTKGVYFRPMQPGEGESEEAVVRHTSEQPKASSVVTCHYKGQLIDGRVFDNSWSESTPVAFRVRELIDGFQAALMAMHVGDHWLVYIPWNHGYGKVNCGPIPGHSTLIFEILLVGIA